MAHATFLNGRVGPAFPHFGLIDQTWPTYRPSLNGSTVRIRTNHRYTICICIQIFLRPLFFRTMWHCDLDCEMQFITCQWSLAACSLGLLMRRSRPNSALARSAAWRRTPVDHNSLTGRGTRNWRVAGFSLSLWGQLAVGGTNLPEKIICALGFFTAVGSSRGFSSI